MIQESDRVLIPTIKPCPFCGEAPLPETYLGWRIACKNAGCPVSPHTSDFYRTMLGCVNAWNTRAEALPAAPLGALEKKL